MKKKYNNSLSSGYTFAEMLVVMAVITIIFAVLLGNRNQLTEKLVLKNEVYNIALFVRQAQVYGLGVRAGGSQNSFNVAYGISFGPLSGGKITSYTFFTDENLNGLYDSGEAHQDYNLGNGVNVKDLCGFNPAIEKCSSQSGIDRIDITFKRPNATANIIFLNSTGNQVGSIIPPAKIYLNSPASTYNMSIRIDSTGGVAIQ